MSEMDSCFDKALAFANELEGDVQIALAANGGFENVSANNPTMGTMSTYHY